MGCKERYCILVLLLCLVSQLTFSVSIVPEMKKEATTTADDHLTAASGQAGAATSSRNGEFGSTNKPTSNPFVSGGIDPLSSDPLPNQSRNTKAKGTLRHLDFTSSASDVLRKHPTWSAPYDCARSCHDNELPRTCYYHFTLELYTVLGAACQLCTPNETNSIWSHCQCVLADGVERGILSANRMLPGPSIQVCENDEVIVDVENHMEAMEVTIHWHGILQRGTQYYDGAPFVTQCPIQQGSVFRYKWKANAGTHFWHSHTGLQKLDGLYGSVIVRQSPSKEPNIHLYDFDLLTHVMLISDWFHENAHERFPGRLANNTGQAPNSVLVNGRGQFRDPDTGFTTSTPLEVFTITAGKRYRFRMINAFSSVCPAQVSVEGHNLTIIATDGEPVEPVQVNSIISFSGERYDFVIEVNNIPGVYWIQVRALGECGIKRVQQLAILRYTKEPYQPSSPPPTYDKGIPQGVVMNPLDAKCDTPRNDAICVNQLNNTEDVDPDILKQVPDVKIYLAFKFFTYTPDVLFQPNTYNRYIVTTGGRLSLSLINGISFMAPPAPLLSQYDDINPKQFCNGTHRPENCGQNCMCTHKVDIPLNSVVEIVLVDEVQVTNLSHAFHLHGQPYYVIGMGRSPDPAVLSINLDDVMFWDKAGLLERHTKSGDRPPGKDTLAVPNNGYLILRFKATNPGFWLMHCHFLFHIAIGMSLVLQVGTQADLPPVPPNFPTCGDHVPQF